MDTSSRHARKCEKLIADFAAARKSGAPIGLGKSTSNLFRKRDQSGTRKIDVRHFNQVLDVDAGRMLVDVEGMTTYEDLVDATLRHGLLPTVVPQLKTITIGGAVSGIGIESSSFRYGLVHETVEKMEILLGTGDIVVCSRTERPDLFYGFPNSYGTLGYVLRLKVRLIPAKPYVALRHTRFSNSESYFAKLCELCASDEPDYLDGVVFSGDEMYITSAQFVDEAPHVSDYTYLQIYYQSIRRLSQDWMSAKGYIWRWDTDWFWCSKQFHVQNAAVRLVATPLLLNSRTYQKVMRLAQKILPASDGTESVIQDVDIPIDNAIAFFDFLMSEIGITPVWICPFRSFDPDGTYPLYSLNPSRLYINFGFWDTVPTNHEDGYFNRKIEEKALELAGKKGLYSTAYYDEPTFWRIYDKRCYDALKQKYDPDNVFPGLYEKCVRRK